MTRWARLFTCVLFVASAFAQTTQQLPTTEGESLAGSKVVLPDAAEGKVAIFIFGFTKASKNATSARSHRPDRRAEAWPLQRYGLCSVTSRHSVAVEPSEMAAIRFR
jgi:hypothetical protein